MKKELKKNPKYIKGVWKYLKFRTLKFGFWYEIKIAKLLTHCRLDGWMDEWMSCDRKRPSQKLTCDILTIWPKMGKREKYNWHFSTLQSKIKNNNFIELEKVYRNELEQKTIEGWSFLLYKKSRGKYWFFARLRFFLLSKWLEWLRGV